MCGWLMVVAFLAVSISFGYSQDLKRQQMTGLLRLAQDYERFGDYERALSTYERLLSLAPGSKVYWEGVKRNLLQLKRYDVLLKRIEQRLARRSDPRLEADLADVAFKMGQAEKAKQIWRNTLDRHKKDASVYQIVAQSMLGNRLYDEAVEVYKLGRKRLKRPTLFVFDLANIYLARMNLQAAVLEYLRYLEREPRQIAYVESRLAAAVNEPEKAEEVISILEQEVQRGNRSPAVHRILAGLYLRTEQFRKALQEYLLLEKLGSSDQPRSAQGADLFAFSEQAMRAGAYEAAQRGYQMIVDRYPNSPFAQRSRLALAQVLQAQGLYEDAVSAYEELLARQPSSPLAHEARYQIGEIQLTGLFRPRAALRSFREVMQRYPNSSRRFDAMLRIGDVYLAMGDMQSAEEWYMRPLALGGKMPVGGIERAQYKLAYLAFLRGQFDDAMEKLKDLTRNAGRNDSGAGENLVNDALELTLFIQENRSQWPQALQLYVKAVRLELQHRYDDSLEILSTLLSQFPTAPIADDALLRVGDIQAAQQNYVEAALTYQRLLDDYPDSFLADVALKKAGEIYETRLQDYAGAQAVYERLLMEHPESVYLEEVRRRLRSLEKRLGS
jgi:tetratricopeptide (TPR) repeat protein